MTVGAFPLEIPLVILYQAICFLDIVRCVDISHKDTTMSSLIANAQYIIMPEHIGYSGIFQ